MKWRGVIAIVMGTLLLVSGCMVDDQEKEIKELQNLIDNLVLGYPIFTESSLCVLEDAGDFVRLKCDEDRIVSRNDDSVVMRGRGFRRFRGGTEDTTVYPNIEPIKKSKEIVLFDEYALIRNLTCGKGYARRISYKVMRGDDYAEIFKPTEKNCANLGNTQDVENCFKCMAKRSGELSFCEKLVSHQGNSTSGTFQRDRCIIDVAIASENPEVCNEISSALISECIIVVAEVTGDPPGCELIENSSYKDACITKKAGYGSRRIRG
ncbi:MAG: hypothetical protein ABH950_00560 [Candidatus Altiarchaeota archaeon]